MSNKIKIGNEFLDGNTLIGQTYSSNNLGDITTRQGSVSNTFSFPKSTKNRKLLGFTDDLNSVERSPYIRIEAELFDGNSFVSKGFLKIVSVTDKFECQFFSGNSEWFSLIKEKTLKDLQGLGGHTYTIGEISAGMTSGNTYAYAPVDYGEFKNNSDPNITATVEQLYPSIFVKRITQQIFYDIGYTIGGDLVNNNTFNKMVIPFSDKEFTHTEQWVLDNTVIENADPQNLGPATSDIIFNGDAAIDVQLRSFYTVQLTINVINVIFNGNYNIFLLKNGSNIATFAIGQLTQVGTLTYTLENIEINPLDININVQFSPLGLSNPIIQIDNSSSISFIPSRIIYEDHEIDHANILPEIKQTDFIKYIFNLFGIIPQVDELSKKVFLNFFRNVEFNKNNADDWSSKIDISSIKEINFTELLKDYSQLSEFNYKENDDDNELVTYEAQNGIRFGSGILNIQNKHLENRSEIYEAPFAPCINILSFDNRLYIPQIKWLNEDATKDVTPKPVIALLVRGFNINDLAAGKSDNGFFNIASVADPGFVFEREFIPFMWFAKATYIPQIDEIQDSLSFGDISFTIEKEGKLLEFWEAYRRSLSNMKYVKANFSLNASDINNLDFTTPKYIDFFKSYFYVNIVKDFTGSEQTTEVELIKLD